MKRFLSGKFNLYFILILLFHPVILSAAGKKNASDKANLVSDREKWVTILYKVSQPVLYNLSQNSLKKNMPVEQRGQTHPEYKYYGDRTKFAYLEAFCRTLSGIAPWLELADDNTKEGMMRKELRELSIKSITNAMNPAAADYMSFDVGNQALVEAAYLGQTFLRAPNNLWAKLDKQTQDRIANELIKIRQVRPNQSNWLLFSAVVETFLYKFGYSYDQMRVDYPVRQFEKWYKGDGVYGDGDPFHWDYYNSYVIQPMLVDITIVFEKEFPGMNQLVLKRSQRYAEVIERFISPEGTIPPLGRSLQYRTATLQSLSQMALLKKLPESLKEGQVRAAMTAVIQRMMSQNGTFDDNGWLKIGFCGSQPEIGEPYTCTGSLYICTNGFLALGLPATDSFWTSPAEVWTAKKAWNGEEFLQDHSIQ